MRKLRIASILALCALAPMLMAPTGGLPIRQTTTTVTSQTWANCSSGGLFELRLVKVGRSVSMIIDHQSGCASASVSQPSASAVVPSSYRPLVETGCGAQVQNNSVPEMGFVTVGTDGTLQVRRGADGAYTSSGNKGLNRDLACAWPTN